MSIYYYLVLFSIYLQESASIRLRTKAHSFFVIMALTGFLFQSPGRGSLRTAGTTTPGPTSARTNAGSPFFQDFLELALNYGFSAVVAAASSAATLTGSG